MLAIVSSHAPSGFDGELVSVEVDIRRGLPGIDLVGLPDNAVRESRERVRVAIRNSAFEFPTDHILVSLAPAGIRKEGASFDLPIALGILAASEQVGPVPAGRIMVLGELTLSGAVRPVRGALSAVAAGLAAGIEDYMVPDENVVEARALEAGRIHGISSLAEAALLYSRLAAGEDPTPSELSGRRGAPAVHSPDASPGDLSDVRGHQNLKRALEIAAAGRHHLLLFGPPGSGKTMAVRRLPGLLPDLVREEALEVTRLHSLAGVLGPCGGLIQRPPVRMPHHSASSEGILGGGRTLRPGEACAGAPRHPFSRRGTRVRLGAAAGPARAGGRGAGHHRAGRFDGHVAGPVPARARVQSLSVRQPWPIGTGLRVQPGGNPPVLETHGWGVAGPRGRAGSRGAGPRQGHVRVAGPRGGAQDRTPGGRGRRGAAPASRRSRIHLERADPPGAGGAFLPARRDGPGRHSSARRIVSRSPHGPSTPCSGSRAPSPTWTGRPTSPTGICARRSSTAGTEMAIFIG